MPKQMFGGVNDRAAKETRRARLWLRSLARRIDHEEVVEHVHEEGRMSGRYIFMIIISGAIATLGLLLSSPAVVIGAMLVSPLMGPIILMGFSLSILEVAALRQSIVTLTVGVFAAIAVAYLITEFSPLTEPTREIIARTRPNLLDLLVAVFSGLAGGYAVIHRKGETIVGVAIATALMPPLAVCGYGLAIGSLAYAGGAFFLFMTNLLAIALTVTVLSRIYGFGAEHSPRHTLMQTLFIVVVFAGLSVPLGFTLRDIAYEATVTNHVRANMLEPFDDDITRIGDLNISFPAGRDIQVEATVLTVDRNPDAGRQLSESFSSRFGRGFAVNLNQVLIDEESNTEDILRRADSSLAAPLREEISRLEQIATSSVAARQREADIRSSLAFPVLAADIEAEARRATFIAEPSDDFSVAAYRAMETRLAENFADWQLQVVPPVVRLPEITFVAAGEALAEEGETALTNSLWAFERWGTGRVEIVVRGPRVPATGTQADLLAARLDVLRQRLAAEDLSVENSRLVQEGEPGTGGPVFSLRPVG